jgi:hypothetical protein
MAGLLLGFLLLGGALVTASFVVLAVFFKLLVRIILLPLFLLKWLLSGILLLILGPVLALVGVVLFLAVGTVVALPLLPFAAVGLVVWLLMRNSRRPAVI